MYTEYIKSALASIKNNKGRAILTMLGIIIGIAAVLTVLIIGDGMKATVNSEMDSIGATTVSVSLDDTKTDKIFSVENLKTIDAGIEGIYGISPSLGGSGYFVTDRASFDANVTGEAPATENAGSVKMLHGRYLSDSDVDEAKKVIVVSQTTAKHVFGYEEVVGQSLTLDAGKTVVDLLVIGVREDNTLDTSFASYLDEPMLMGEIPYTTAADIYMYNTENLTRNFTIYMDKENKDEVLSRTRSVVENVLGIRGENAVKISSGYGFDETTDQILTIITTVVAIIAAISLLVGGIGVMNIMTVSVTERTREIGIRKAVGAKMNSIMTQFIAEAAILTFTGGMIGVITGLTIAFILCRIVDFEFIVNPVLVIVVVAISTAIGLFFGIYPAKKAANLDPIEALRME